MVQICVEVKRVLKKTGSMYIVMGDTYYGGKGKSGYELPHEAEKRKKEVLTLQGSQNVPGYIEARPQDLPQENYQPKCLMGIPWRLAFSLIDDGWTLRNAIIWHKPNAMPSSVKDRLTCTYETIFHFVKNRKYYYDLDAIREPHSTGTFKRIFQKNVFQQSGGKKQVKLRGKKRSAKDRGSRCADMVKSISEKYVKHDLAVVRVGGFSYADPLHTKKYHLKGKNPGDTIRSKWSNVPSQPTQGNFGRGGTHGNRFNHPLGKNPGDIFQAKKKPYMGNNPHRMRLHKNCYAPLNPERPEDLSHPLGKNPGDVVHSKYPTKDEEAQHRQGMHRLRSEEWSLQRVHKPSQTEIAKYLREWIKKRGLTYKQIDDHFGYGDACSHWVELNPGSKHGAALPTPEDWLKLKQLLGFDNKYDKLMTKVHWVNQAIKECPMGRNPGDVISERVKANLEHFIKRGSGGHYAYGGLDSEDGKHQNPKGKNPGDVTNYSPREPRHFQLLRMGIPHGGHTGKTVRHNNPLGKNPGDVIKIGMHHGSSLTSGRATHHEGQIIESHPLGKNPGDILRVKKRIGDAHKGEVTAGLYLPHKAYHELGRNPGDVIHLDRDKTAVEDFRTGRSIKLPPEPQNPAAFHRKGKNPGDIIKTRWDSSEIMAQSGAHRYHSRTGIHQEGINLGRYRYAKGGKNPGDVLKQADEMIKRHPTHPPHHAPRIRLSDWNPHEWMQHPLGKNPGDIILDKGAKTGKVKIKSDQLDDIYPNCGRAFIPCSMDEPDPSDFWSITTKPFKGPHFAVYPEEICIKPIKSSCPPDGIVLDPMCGSGTTLVAAKKWGRKYIGFDINPRYVEIAKKRLREISIG